MSKESSDSTDKGSLVDVVLVFTVGVCSGGLLWGVYLIARAALMLAGVQFRSM